MSETPFEPEANPSDEPEILPAGDPDGGSTVMPTDPHAPEPDGP
ncbi:hypothetical protein [Aeromicrobium sp.]